jgi:hypothetical protein
MTANQLEDLIKVTSQLGGPRRSYFNNDIRMSQADGGSDAGRMSGGNITRNLNFT